MRDENAALLCRPFQHRRVVLAGKRDILNSNKIQSRFAALQSTEDIIVEVLVESQTDHSIIRAGSGLARQKARADTVRVELALVFRCNSLPVFGAFL